MAGMVARPPPPLPAPAAAISHYADEQMPVRWHAMAITLPPATPGAFSCHGWLRFRLFATPLFLLG